MRNPISSEDPNAIEQLTQKIEALERNQARNKAINAAIKRGARGDADLKAMGLEDWHIAKLRTPDFAGHIGIPAYELTNNNANIRRLKKRVEELTRAKTRTTSEAEIDGGIRIVQNVEDCRVQIFFPGKPEQSVIDQLKGNGFHWTPTVGCWQRLLNDSAIATAHYILKSPSPIVYGTEEPTQPPETLPCDECADTGAVEGCEHTAVTA